MSLAARESEAAAARRLHRDRRGITSEPQARSPAGRPGRVRLVTVTVTVTSPVKPGTS